jgi:MraZ protein
MALFLSTCINRIDRKGRLSIPAPFRAILNQSATPGVVALKAPQVPAVECFSHERLEKLAARIDELPFCSEEHQDLTTTFFASVSPLSFDPEGRITLPQDFMTWANLSGEVAVVGRGHVFQIWNRAAFETFSAEAQARTRQNPAMMRLVLGGATP